MKSLTYLLILSHSFFGVHALGQVASSEEYLSDLKNEMQKKWPGNRSVTLVFHGHSVPAGYFKTPVVNTFGAYPMQVLRLIKDQYPYAVVNVINTAIGGENAESGAKRFATEVLIHKPDVLFIDYALNDRGIGLEKAKMAWESMIRQALDQGIKVILLTPSPDQREDILKKESALEAHAAQIRGLSEKYSVGLIDSYALFQEKVSSGEAVSDYMSQVNHPNEKGHSLIANALYSYFNPPGKPLIQKLGTVDPDIVETSPFVFNNKLYRLESVKDYHRDNALGKPYLQVKEVESGNTLPYFGKGYILGSAFVPGDTAWVYGVDKPGSPRVTVFWSTDLKNWKSKIALSAKGWEIFNTSVCKVDNRYVMAFEVGAPEEVTGVRFTTRFAESKDLLNWTILPEPRVYSKDRYTACPTLRYYDGYYYMTYLEHRPERQFETYIVRSTDLITWESSRLNPVLQFSPEDKLIYNTTLSEELQSEIVDHVNINNSDFDLCEYKGKVHIYYSWGNQRGIEHLAYAIYEGSERDFLKGFFPE
ncbi:MAG: GDSL-type esterase/lipase family protein [Cyclobacteriaceae bacterium]|nr:GDSL-type esterase/lipase family protein [Cyclobacteriaceae bacterium]